MEKSDIEKVSQHFGIPQQDIINALDNDKSKNLNHLKKKKAMDSFFSAKNKESRKEYLKEWLQFSESFEEQEDIFICAEGKEEEELVADQRIDFCQTAEQVKKVFLCLGNNEVLRNKALRKWIELGSNLEDVREAKKYIKPNSEESILATKKMIKFY